MVTVVGQGYDVRMLIVVAQAELDAVLPLVSALEEFQESQPHVKESYLETMQGKRNVVLLASHEGNPAGFLIAYDRFGDDSLYCWRTGVLPAFRRQGVLRTMMGALEQWARKEGFRSLKLVTRNSRREMLAFLVRDGFRFTEIIPKETVEDFRIRAEKPL